MKINRNSWHYKLIKMGDSWEMPSDLCSYVRLLIWNILVVLFTVASCSFVIGVGIWAPIHLVLHGIPDTHSMLYGFSIIGLVVDVVVLVVTIIYFLERVGEYQQENRIAKQPKPIKDPSFIKKAWEGFKEKTCYRIDFED